MHGNPGIHSSRQADATRSPVSPGSTTTPIASRTRSAANGRGKDIQGASVCYHVRPRSLIDQHDPRSVCIGEAAITAAAAAVARAARAAGVAGPRQQAVSATPARAAGTTGESISTVARPGSRFPPARPRRRSPSSQW